MTNEEKLTVFDERVATLEGFEDTAGGENLLRGYRKADEDWRMSIMLWLWDEEDGYEVSFGVSLDDMVVYDERYPWKDDATIAQTWLQVLVDLKTWGIRAEEYLSNNPEYVSDSADVKGVDWFKTI